MFTTRYATELPGTYTKVMPTPLRNPNWVCWNQTLADRLQLPAQKNAQTLSVFAGEGLFEGTDPIAQKYAGHQFGGWNPDLGDGRGLLLGEWNNAHGETWEFHLKGAGKTPYSRFGDGRAVLRSSIREFLGSEALAALGIPSTRALGVVGSTEEVLRETVEPGATIIRVSQSHIRFGHFEWFAFSDQSDALRNLVDYTLRHHFSNPKNTSVPSHTLFEMVVDNTAKMIAHWMAYGFCHGVMNTDNMSIVGETFDYGPYAFLDQTDFGAVFNHSDPQGRYAFNQQPHVGFWNLQRLAHALSVIADIEPLAEILSTYSHRYQHYYYQRLNARLGGTDDKRIATSVLDEWLSLLQDEKKDFHTEFRALSSLPLNQWMSRKDEFVDGSRYQNWCHRIVQQTNSKDDQRMAQMAGVNPATVARTHHLQAVIDAAHHGDFAPLESFFSALRSPFEEKAEWTQWHSAPDSTTQSGQLSCSS